MSFHKSSKTTDERGVDCIRFSNKITKSLSKSNNLIIFQVSNINWPSKTGLTVDQQKSEFKQLIIESKKDNLNAVIVQIRPTADSFYPSKLFPWSEWLSGKQGDNPGYDPLQFMIDESHQANLEFHAWLNPYRISTQVK